MKTIRNLSGIYFRQQNPKTLKWENICFEDCTPEKQDEILNHKDPEFVKSLARQLAETIKRLGNQFDIVTSSSEDVEDN